MESSPPKFKLLLKWAIAFGWVYFTLLLGWLAVYTLGGDWGGVLVPVNALAGWMFLPLPVFFGLGIVTRRKELWLAGAAGLAAGLYLWGGLFLPGPLQAAAQVSPSSASLRVMTYNVYGFNPDGQGVVAAIRSGSPDVVCFQELNPEIAAAVLEALGADYPYRSLDARAGVNGMGTISKYPLRPGSRVLPLQWIGTPQVLVLDWNGKSIELVNFHMHPPGRLALEALRQRHAYRQQQAEALAQFAEEAARPLLLAGDANATDLNEAYKTITRGGLRDAWRETGQGMGFTFPRQLGGLYPAWMARIDYVFLSPDWLIQSAELTPTDGGSDHRGIVVEANLPGD